MAWDGLIGHTDQMEMLRRSIARDRLAHTYLLAGPAGIGKRRFAQGWAECLLCERCSERELEACGRCSGCKQVRALTHPDLLVIGRPEGKSEIPLDLILGPPERRGRQGLCYDLSLKPMSGQRKVAIIDDADHLNEEGANSLLKTLEEPPPHSLMMLIATTPEALLPTIRSRCQILRFQPLPEQAVCDIMLREGMTEDPREAAEVAALSEGSLETTAQLLDPHLREQRAVLYDALASDPFRSAQVSALMHESIDAAGTEASAQRSHAAWLIRFTIEFYRRALRRLSGVDADAALPPQVVRFADRMRQRPRQNLEIVGDLLERSMTAERDLESKASVQLCMEALFDDLGQIGRRGVAERH